MARVLVVELGDSLRAAIELEGDGFTVVTALHLHEVLSSSDALRPDLVVVEGAASRTAVLDLCATVHASLVVPILLLSPPCSERDAVAAYGTGIDALILEPVGRHELVARVRALLRRVPPERPDATTDRITVGPVVLDAARRELFVHGKEVRTPRREFDIAALLMREAGRVVPRQTIVRELWGSLRDTKSLDVQVGRLRARLAAAEGQRRIVTVRGVGYRFLHDDDPLLGGEPDMLEGLAPA
jgi:two-component system response regulator RegX3